LPRHGPALRWLAKVAAVAILAAADATPAPSTSTTALALGWVFLRTGSILPGVVLHAANNLWFTASSHGRHAILDWLCGR
jgi:membrane protease YdiL (CAAX protease family)